MFRSNNSYRTSPFLSLFQSLASFISNWQFIDWFLILLVIALSSLGGLTIQSIQKLKELTEWQQHFVIEGVGIFVAFFLARLPYNALLKWHWTTYTITNISLIAVIFIGTTAKGAQSWINIGGFNVQPSEFAKVGVIITLAALLHERSASTIPSIMRTIGITLIPWGLILLQPDLGTSLVFGAITLTMLYWANANLGWILIMVSPLTSVILFGLMNYYSNIYALKLVWLGWVLGIGLIAWLTLPWRYGIPRFLSTITVLGMNLMAGVLGQILWGILKPYQKARITMFLNPEQDPLGSGYHLIQSRIAIGSGELQGLGLYRGTQTQLDFIPEQHTDFIFSAIGEEWGFIGAGLVVLVYWLICWRLLVIARNAKDDFGSLLAIGVLAMIAFQAVINIGMTIGVAPITGIPLPFLSYGRSSLLKCFIAIGLVESVANSRQRKRKF